MIYWTGKKDLKMGFGRNVVIIINVLVTAQRGLNPETPVYHVFKNILYYTQKCQNTINRLKNVLEKYSMH